MRGGCADSWVTGVFFWVFMVAFVGGIVSLTQPLFRALPFLPQAKPLLVLAWGIFFAFWLVQVLVWCAGDFSWLRLRVFGAAFLWGVTGNLWLNATFEMLNLWLVIDRDVLELFGVISATMYLAISLSLFQLWTQKQ